MSTSPWSERALVLAVALAALAAVGCERITADALPGGQAPNAARPATAQQGAARRCDRSKIVEETESMNRTGHHDGALKFARRFFTECGEYHRLRWVTYTAYKRLGQFDKAAAEASKLIAHRPDDKDYRWWRGLAYELGGELDKAVADYRQALLLQPKLDRIPFNLADVLEKQGKPCQALLPLRQYLYYHPEHRTDDAVKRRLSRLSRRGGCDEGSGAGKQVIRLAKKIPAFLAPVQVNGRTRASLVVDDKATYVVLSEDLAEQAGIVAGGAPITMTTNSGVYHGRLALAPSIRLGRLRASDVEVIVADAVPAEVDGLLGLSFIARFEMAYFPSQKRIVLSKRSRFALDGLGTLSARAAAD